MTATNAQRVILRPLCTADATTTVSWRRDSLLIDGALGHPFPVTIENERHWIENLGGSPFPQKVVFGIERKEDAQLVGYVQLMEIDWISRCAEFGLVIGVPEVRGQGCGEEASSLMMNYAFTTLNLRRLWLRVVESNEAAFELYSALGFQQEGCLREHAHRADKYQDVIIMGLMRNSEQT